VDRALRAYTGPTGGLPSHAQSCGFLLEAGAASPAHPPDVPEIRVFVFAGSSNALGYGADAAELPPELGSPQGDIRFWFDDGIFIDGPRVTSGGTLVPLQAQPNDPSGSVFGPWSGPPIPSGFGPELSAGRALADASTVPVAIVKVASDGSNLAVHWKPDQGGGLFSRITDAVDQTKSQLTQLGYAPVVSGFFWLQGETDAQVQSFAAKYERDLGHFIMKLRQKLDAPSLPIVIGRPKAIIACGPFGCFPFLAEVRDAQAAVALATADVVLVDSDDLAVLSDGAHFTAASQLTRGQRLADAWLALP
jgi:hypothetical protein